MSGDHMLDDPDDTPENEVKELLWEQIRDDHPNWTSEEVEEEVEARWKKIQDEDAEGRDDQRALSREYDREGY